MKNIHLSFKLSLVFIILSFLTSCAANREMTGQNKLDTDQKEVLKQVKMENKKLTSDILFFREKNTSLQTENDLLKSQLMAARASLNEISSQEPECPEAMEKGIVFKVQIGAYEDRELSSELTNSVIIDTEEKGDLQKTVIGQFRDYDKAERLKTQLRAMGVEDAWIVSYKDGVRVDIEVALAERNANGK